MARSLTFKTPEERGSYRNGKSFREWTEVDMVRVGPEKDHTFTITIKRMHMSDRQNGMNGTLAADRDDYRFDKEEERKRLQYKLEGRTFKAPALYSQLWEAWKRRRL